jgi:hypothetical protein
MTATPFNEPRLAGQIKRVHAVGRIAERMAIAKT